MFLFCLLGFRGFLRIVGFLGFISLFRLVRFLRLVGLLGFFGLLSRLFFLLFRSLHRFLLDLFLFQLFDFGLTRSRFLRFTRNLLIGLGGRPTFRFQLVQGRLDNRLGRRQLRCEGKTDEQHAEHQHVQANRPDTRPEVAFRGGRLSLLLHQGASVIKPTLPTPAFCNPPMAPITEP
ncbi:hypothetical protein D3C73_532280 [compost metagenome]